MFRSPLSINVFEEFWKEIEEKWHVILTINIAGEKKITAYEQFAGYFSERKLKYFNKESLRIQFHTIFISNRFILIQLDKLETDLERELANLDNWSDVVTTVGSINSGGVTHSETGILNKLVGAASDSNSNATAELIEQHFDINEKPILPANTLNLSMTADLNESNTSSITTGTNKNVSTTSNNSNDFIQFLRLEIPVLRHKFFNSFNCLFDI